MNETNKRREELESLLDEWNTEFDELEAKIRSSGADPKDDHDKVITELRLQRHNAKAYFG